MGQLTTHVLDTMRGAPAAGMKIELFSVDDGEKLLASAVTNSDGRVDGPLLSGDAFEAGRYQILFHAGHYFENTDSVADPAFLGMVPIRFGIADPDAHYHVPLLVSPWSYTTYRGS